MKDSKKIEPLSFTARMRSGWIRLRTGLRKPGGRRLFWAFYGLALLLVACLGGAAGVIFGYTLDLPRVAELAEVRPDTVTVIYGDDGRVIGEMAVERRVLVTYEEISPLIKNAVLAVEDGDFFQHAGVDWQRVFTTAVKNVLRGERRGASTLTMQLSKLRFTGYEQTWERKIKDALHAVEIEKTYSKEQILTFYFNQIWMGHGVYGIGSAARFYFDKSLAELTLPEAALLAGMIRWPPRYSPINSIKRAQARRDIALRRMFEEGYITEEERREAVESPVQLNIRRQDPGVADYAVEEVRRQLSEKGYDVDDIWNQGLRIHTTINYDLQVAANQALRDGLKRFDKQRRPWQGAPENILTRGIDLEQYVHPEWRQIFHVGEMVHGLVLESSPQSAKVKIGSYTSIMTPKEVAWTKKKKVNRVLKKGDVAVFVLDEIDRHRRVIKAHLDRIPEVQGGLVVIDNKTGGIKAMVGGFDYHYSEFNRVVQALRQPGSIFKPFTYVAAFEDGYTPLDTILDEKVTFFDALDRPYEPGNSDGKYKGWMPLYQAMGESRNLPTLRLADKLGIERVIAVAHRFGIRRDLLPVLPMAIGAGEVTLLEMTSAFTAFVNQGFRAEPFLVARIEDYDQTLKEEHQPDVREAVPSEIASQMLFMLRGTVLQPHGTARAALRLKRPVAGKTGTTNDYTDSWFVGLTPQITAGVWVGHDAKKTLGEKVYGATLALPIWIDFMERISDKLPVEEFDDSFDIQLSEIVYAPDPEDDAPLKGDVRRIRPSGMTVEDIPPPPPPQR